MLRWIFEHVIPRLHPTGLVTASASEPRSSSDDYWHEQGVRTHCPACWDRLPCGYDEDDEEIGPVYECDCGWWGHTPDYDDYEELEVKWT